MIYTSEKGIKVIMLVFLLVFFFVVVYFVSEVKKVEKTYDDIAQELILDK